MKTLLPGEWITIDEDDAEEFWFRDGFSEVRTSDGELICVAPAPNNVERSRLFAAAPDMYAALSAARDAWVSPPTNIQQEEWSALVDHLIQEMDAALSKARGPAQ